MFVMVMVVLLVVDVGGVIVDVFIAVLLLMVLVLLLFLLCCCCCCLHRRHRFLLLVFLFFLVLGCSHVVSSCSPCPCIGRVPVAVTFLLFLCLCRGVVLALCKSRCAFLVPALVVFLVAALALIGLSSLLFCFSVRQTSGPPFDHRPPFLPPSPRCRPTHRHLIIYSCYLVLQQKPKTRDLAKLGVCHPGQSYNPTEDDHDDVLASAVAVELKRQEAVEDEQRPLAMGLSKETLALMTQEDEEVRG